MLPDWVEKTSWGSLICLFCGSLALQLTQIWICTEPTCKKHDDTPVENRQGFFGWVRTDPSVGTASIYPSELKRAIGGDQNG